jgi:hypothetical protein
MNTRAAAALLALTVAGCAAIPPPPPPPPPPSSENTFRRQDFAWSIVQGRNSISGTLAQGWRCAGGSVGLTPETPYSRSRIRRLYGSTDRAVRSVEEIRSRQVSEARDDYSAYVRTTTCDQRNRFRFERLPDGAWYVIARANPPGSGGDEPKAVMRRVVTVGGRAISVTLP